MAAWELSSASPIPKPPTKWSVGRTAAEAFPRRPAKIPTRSGRNWYYLSSYLGLFAEQTTSEIYILILLYFHLFIYFSVKVQRFEASLLNLT